MGTSAIDLMQSSDIAQLQTDVTELNTKLNALIVEFNKCYCWVYLIRKIFCNNCRPLL